MKRLFSIIDRAPLWLGIGALVSIGGLILFFQNMRYSIQFTGGIEAVVEAQEISEDFSNQLASDLVDAGYTVDLVGVGEKEGFPSLLIQMQLEGDEQVDTITEFLEEKLVSANIIESADDIMELSIIGPSIGDYIKKSAQTALIAGTIFMALYILFAFSSMRALISPALLGVVTIITMIFDVSLPAGAYGLLMWMNHAVQVDTVFIIALLTVMGYSVNDTIIIFDRVRENFAEKQAQIEKGKISVGEIFEMSLWQTMKRSIGTSLSTFLVVAAMYIFGTGVLQTFAFVLGIGVIAGTYSSIFLAAPFAYLVAAKKLEESKK